MAMSCLGCAPGCLRPFSLAAFVWEHPLIIRNAAARHPGKLLELLLRLDMRAAREVCDALPEEAASGLFAVLLENVRKKRIVNVLVPLLNNSWLNGTIAEIAHEMSPDSMAEIIDAVDYRRLSAFLQAPLDKLKALASSVEPNRIGRFLIPFLAEKGMPVGVLEEKVVPFLRSLRRVDHLCTLINQLEDPDVLLWLLRGDVPAKRLAQLFDSFGPEEFRPEGRVIALMRELGDHRGLVNTKVAPLLAGGDIDKISQMVRMLPGPRLVEVLQNNDTGRILWLMDHMTADWMVTINLWRTRQSLSDSPPPTPSATPTAPSTPEGQSVSEAAMDATTEDAGASQLRVAAAAAQGTAQPGQVARVTLCSCSARESWYRRCCDSIRRVFPICAAANYSQPFKRISTFELTAGDLLDSEAWHEVDIAHARKL